MRKLTPGASHSHDTSFSLVQGGPSYRIQQTLGLIPSRGLGVPRRVLLLVLLTWAPIIVWAIVTSRRIAHLDLHLVPTHPLEQYLNTSVVKQRRI